MNICHDLDLLRTQYILHFVEKVANFASSELSLLINGHCLCFIHSRKIKAVGLIKLLI